MFRLDEVLLIALPCVCSSNLAPTTHFYSHFYPHSFSPCHPLPLLYSHAHPNISNPPRPSSLLHLSPFCMQSGPSKEQGTEGHTSHLQAMARHHHVHPQSAMRRHWGQRTTACLVHVLVTAAVAAAMTCRAAATWRRGRGRRCRRGCQAQTASMTPIQTQQRRIKHVSNTLGHKSVRLLKKKIVVAEQSFPAQLPENKAVVP